MSGMRVVELNLEALDLKYARLSVRRPAAERRLLASLGESGQQSPVIVVAGAEPGRYVVVDGHKRVHALGRLKADVAKAAVWEMTEAEALAMAYQMGAQGKRDAFEEGWLVAELHRAWRWSLGEVAERLVRSKSWVSKRLALVEELPDWLAEEVASGRLGAHAAANFLVPLTRVNGPEGRQLIEKICALELSGRQIQALCAGYRAAAASARRKIAEDPARFLKALEAARSGPQDPDLSETENRALKQMELIGNIALGLTRNLPQVLGYDAGPVACARLWAAWESAQKRMTLLVEAASALKAAQKPNTEDKHAQSGNTDGDLDAARSKSRQPQDRQGPGGWAHGGAGSDSERAPGSLAAAGQASPA